MTEPIEPTEPRPDDRDEVATAVRFAGDQAVLQVSDPCLTIEPAYPPPSTAAESATSVLERLMLGAEPRVLIEDTLGEGGMGVVKLAHQVALGRSVAVKSLHPSKKTPSNTTKLMREAWVIGSLEHPNVVPVYDIDVDAEGTPLVVLKRIAGVDWATLMNDAAAVEERFGARDLLEWNLAILMQVLNAVRFAHSRGIVHRDLKPDNVMIGEFGEVYLVDWGLAVSLSGDDRRLPVIPDDKKLAGTPRYMAPEMLGDSTVAISERTDVYLAGAILYQILTGTPPHNGMTAGQILYSIVRSRPVLPDHVPARLATICRTAMQKDPAERFAGAEAMRLALQDYLQHRGAERLAEQAAARLDELAATLADLAGRPASADNAEARQQLYKLFGACRFGFRESLATWPGNPAATDGMTRAIHLMIDHELGQGDPGSAAALLAELADPPAELRARIDAALAEKEAEKERLAELERLAHTLDARVGRRVRQVTASSLGIAWVLSPWLNTWAGHAAADSDGASLAASAAAENAAYLRSMSVSAVLLVICIGIGAWVRRNLADSVINQRYYVGLIGFYVLILTLEIGMLIAGVPYATMLHARIFGVLVFITVLAIAMEHRFWPTVLANVIAFVMVALRAELYPYVASMANLVVTLNAAFIWRRPRDGAATAPGDSATLSPPAGRRPDRDRREPS